MPILAVVTVFAATTVPVEAQENQVTSIRPGENYYVYAIVKKPAGMTLTTNWEIRFYAYKGLNCYNLGTWWHIEPDIWLYTGYWDYRVRNELWTSPDNRTFGVYLPIVNYPRENPYPLPEGENYLGKMDEIPIGENIYIRARLLLRNLSGVTFDTTNQIVMFKYGSQTYSYTYSLSAYGDVRLDEIDGTLRQSEGTGEWSLGWDQDVTVLVDNNAPATGEIFCGMIDFSRFSPPIVDHWTGLPWIIIIVFFVVGCLIGGWVIAWKKGFLKIFWRWLRSRAC